MTVENELVTIAISQDEARLLRDVLLALTHRAETASPNESTYPEETKAQALQMRRIVDAINRAWPRAGGCGPGCLAPHSVTGHHRCPSSSDELLAIVVDAARRHGEESDPDHEVGDLQDFVAICWLKLTSQERHEAVEQFKGSHPDLYEEDQS